jgi:hypothetical protein
MTLHQVLPRYPSATAKDKTESAVMFSNLSTRRASDGLNAVLMSYEEQTSFFQISHMRIKCTTILSVEIQIGFAVERFKSDD